jgi:crotonobetainyl-CoA:carnitine CoA-transferase CaiB-like acyl-CoA transferase
VSAGPLEGVRVLDLTIMAAGPWTTSLLGQLGADVIKVEPPAGDGTRWVHPYQSGLGTNYLAMNVNKTSMTLDLRDDEDRGYLLSLVPKADIFVQNFSGGVADRLGVGYAALSAANPALLYCSISGFGAPEPLRTAKAADYIIQAFSGFASGNGHQAGEFEQFRFTGFIDLATATVAVQAVLAALVQRQATGAGCHLDIPMVEAALEMQYTRVANHLLAGEEPECSGSDGDLLCPDGAFQALDKPVFITVRDDAEWATFCATLDAPDLANDTRFTTNVDRVRNRRALRAEVEPLIGARPAMWWLRWLRRHGLCVAIAQDADIFNRHEQVVSNDMIGRLATQWGDIEVGGCPWRFSQTPTTLTAPPVPGSGERVKFQ